MVFELDKIDQERANKRAIRQQPKREGSFTSVSGESVRWPRMIWMDKWFINITINFGCVYYWISILYDTLCNLKKIDRYCCYWGDHMEMRICEMVENMLNLAQWLRIQLNIADDMRYFMYLTRFVLSGNEGMSWLCKICLKMANFHSNRYWSAMLAQLGKYFTYPNSCTICPSSSISLYCICHI